MKRHIWLGCGAMLMSIAIFHLEEYVDWTPYLAGPAILPVVLVLYFLPPAWYGWSTGAAIAVGAVYFYFCLLALTRPSSSKKRNFAILLVMAAVSACAYVMGEFFFNFKL
jgi:hypothetical protein